jgi:formate dehydrogenase major subunit
MVMELLVSDQPARETSHDPDSKFWNWAETVGVTESRFPPRSAGRAMPAIRRCASISMPASSAGLCVRACREVQVNDVIGMAYRNADAKIVFDFDDPMGNRPASPAANACRPARPAR